MPAVAMIPLTGTTNYRYGSAGRTSLTRGNGTAKSYSYDAASRLASMGEDLTGRTSDLTLGFTYNPASQIVTAAAGFADGSASGVGRC